MLALRYYRIKRGLTQSDLAHLVKTQQPTISDIERGRRTPGDGLLDALADVLGVTPAFALLRPVVVDEHVQFADERVSA